MYGIFKLKTVTTLLLVTIIAISLAYLFSVHKSEITSAPIKEEAHVPIIMYHSVLKDPARTGEYVITPDMLRSDFEYLKKHGYTAVSASELISYVHDGTPLPEKPVMITFDDGFLNNIEYALPLLREYSMCAVISVVGAYCDVYTNEPDRNLYYSYMTWDDVRDAEELLEIEIASHSYDMHSQYPRRGASQMDGEDDSRYKAVFRADVESMKSALLKNSGIDCRIYTYPLGAVSEGSRDILRGAGVLMSLSCYEHINTLKMGEHDCLYELGRFNRSGLVSTDEFMAKAKIE